MIWYLVSNEIAGGYFIRWLECAIPRVGQYNITVLYLTAGNFLNDLVSNDYAISDVVVNFVTKGVFRLKTKTKTKRNRMLWAIMD